MMKNTKYKVEENFVDFIRGSKAIQTLNSVQPAQFGANPGDQYNLPFEFEQRPEIGEDVNNKIITILEKIQSISTAGINKANILNRTESVSNPYIERALTVAYSNLREAYLRLMDLK